MTTLKINGVARRRRVDFVADETDRRILQLACLGRPMKYIAFVTNRTVAEVAYRLRRGRGFKLREIRGGSDAHRVMSTLEDSPHVRRLTARVVKDVLAAEQVVRAGRMVDHRAKKVEPDYEGRIDSRTPHRQPPDPPGRPARAAG